jgi:hypothetical protein
MAFCSIQISCSSTVVCYLVFDLEVPSSNHIWGTTSSLLFFYRWQEGPTGQRTPAMSQLPAPSHRPSQLPRPACQPARLSLPSVRKVSPISLFFQKWQNLFQSCKIHIFWLVTQSILYESSSKKCEESEYAIHMPVYISHPVVTW